MAAVALVLAGLALPDHDGPSRAAARTRVAPEPARFRARETHAHRSRARTAHPPYAPASGRAVVSVLPDAPGRAIPRSYLGLSTEYWALPVFERRMRLMQGCCRCSAWRGTGRWCCGSAGTRPTTRSGIRAAPPADLGVRAHPGLAAADERAGEPLRRSADPRPEPGHRLAGERRRVGAGGVQRPAAHSVSGFEIGNEPDIYSRWYWRAVISAGAVQDAVLPRDLTAASYTHDFASLCPLAGQGRAGRAAGRPGAGQPGGHERLVLRR